MSTSTTRIPMRGVLSNERRSVQHEPVFVDDIVVLNKEHERLEHVGLTLAEAKALLESLVNSLLSTRFAKKQSMQWTPEGAHLLLQTCTRALRPEDHINRVFTPEVLRHVERLEEVCQTHRSA
jgi:hypothetical protein